MATEEGENRIGEAIDRLDNLVHALEIPMADGFHLKQLRQLLPEVVKELKGAYVEAFGWDPWEGNPE